LGGREAGREGCEEFRDSFISLPFSPTKTESTWSETRTLTSTSTWHRREGGREEGGGREGRRGEEEEERQQET